MTEDILSLKMASECKEIMPDLNPVTLRDIKEDIVDTNIKHNFKIQECVIHSSGSFRGTKLRSKPFMI